MTRCACCPKEVTGWAWETGLCDEHFHAWWLAAPYPVQVEAGYAADPKIAEHVEKIFETQYFGRQVVLKPGVHGRYMTSWTRKWAKAQQVAVAA